MVSSCKNCGAPLKPDTRFCSSCGSQVAPAGSVQSETALPSASRSIRKPLKGAARAIYVAIILVMAGVFLYIFQNALPGGSNPVISGQPDISMSTLYTGQTLEQQFITPTIRNGIISFPLSLLLEKKIVAFDYQTPTAKVPLMAYISAEGKLVTAVRMCEPCNSTTFRIDGVELVCGNCGTRWKQNNLEGVSGNCQKYPPDPIPSRLVNSDVQIDESYVKNWKMRI